MKHAGNQLKKEIKKLGLTQEEAASRLGITRQTLGQWMKRQEFDANTLQNVKAKLGVDLEAPEDLEQKDVRVPREVFDKISQLIDTVCSQQGTIASQQNLLLRQQDLVNKVLNPPPHEKDNMDCRDSEGGSGSVAVG